MSHRTQFDEKISFVTTIEIRTKLSNFANVTMIMLHTEIFNETNDPHQSIWAPRLAEYYLTLEGYYKVKKIQENVILDNRDWYFKVMAETVDEKL